MDIYVPCQTYEPPTGRLAVLGKARAAVDKIRKEMESADFSNHVNVQGLYSQQKKVNADIAALEIKTDSEVLLLNQKAITELSQTCDTLDTSVGMNNTSSVQGVIEKQKGLFQKQTDGFDRDAEQKLSKIMVDTWSVRQTTDTADAAGAGLSDVEINSVLDKAKNGINV